MNHYQGTIQLFKDHEQDIKTGRPRKYLAEYVPSFLLIKTI